MKKQFYIYIVLIMFINILSCNNDEEAQTQENNKTNTELPGEDEAKVQNLIIDGENIWIRSEPTTGEVTMKLNTGDKCIILKKGEQETVNGSTDFWYKIEYKNKTGWVFGSQTSLKTGIISSESSPEQNKELMHNISKVVENIRTDLKNIQKLYYDPTGILIINNPGAYTVLEFSDNTDRLKYFSNEDEKCLAKLKKWPEFDYDSYTWKKSGCFVEKINGTDIFSKTAKNMKDFEMPVSDYTIKKATDLGSKVRLKVLHTKTSTRFYFAYKNGQWKLVGVDISDFSA